MPLNPLIINSLAEAVSSEQMILTDLRFRSSPSPKRIYSSAPELRCILINTSERCDVPAIEAAK